MNSKLIGILTLAVVLLPVGANADQQSIRFISDKYGEFTLEPICVRNIALDEVKDGISSIILSLKDSDSCGKELYEKILSHEGDYISILYGENTILPPTLLSSKIDPTSGFRINITDPELATEIYDVLSGSS
ncbi:hypothetical protein [Nitrincola sp.]|uniref:hypothetical protein n=1 Tax=Nitrincola sp. TaxID=1926584 RepID=UPI003A8D7659